MPEMRFTVRWPDDTVTDCYSPSLVIKDYFAVGESYPIADFLERASSALNIASERVYQKYGYACSSALDQLKQIEATVERHSAHPDARVKVEGFSS
jgi:uncharacterized repeat protein (TIGR04042 family)